MWPESTMTFIADALSRLQNGQLASSHPELVISTFQPSSYAGASYEPLATISGQTTS